MVSKLTAVGQIRRLSVCSSQGRPVQYPQSKVCYRQIADYQHRYVAAFFDLKQSLALVWIDAVGSSLDSLPDAGDAENWNEAIFIR